MEHYTTSMGKWVVKVGGFRCRLDRRGKKLMWLAGGVIPKCSTRCTTHTAVKLLLKPASSRSHERERESSKLLLSNIRQNKNVRGERQKTSMRSLVKIIVCTEAFKHFRAEFDAKHVALNCIAKFRMYAIESKRKNTLLQFHTGCDGLKSAIQRWHPQVAAIIS